MMTVPAIKMNAAPPEIMPNNGASGARGKLKDGGQYVPAKGVVSAATLR
jgi:hypothetical protein